MHSLPTCRPSATLNLARGSLSLQPLPCPHDRKPEGVGMPLQRYVNYKPLNRNRRYLKRETMWVPKSHGSSEAVQEGIPGRVCGSLQGIAAGLSRPAKLLQLRARRKTWTSFHLPRLMEPWTTQNESLVSEMSKSSGGFRQACRAQQYSWFLHARLLIFAMYPSRDHHLDMGAVLMMWPLSGLVAQAVV